jgi:hypothetical protein
MVFLSRAGIQRLESIIALVQPHIVRLVGDNCGCRVVQRLFDKYSVDQFAPKSCAQLQSSGQTSTGIM